MTLKSEIRDEINKNKPKLCKGKIVNKLYCILLTTLEFLDYIFFEKKTVIEVHYFSL